MPRGVPVATVAVVLAVAAIVGAALYRFAPGDMKKMHAPGWLTDGDPFPAGLPFAPSWALWGIIIMSMWGVGQMAVIYLAKLQDVPVELYEAAEIDGAGAWRKFRNITLPMISPAMFFMFVMGLIHALQVFTQAYLVTQGGPVNSTLFYVLYLYREAFENLHMGYASAMAWVLFIVILAITGVQFVLARRWVYYEGAQR